MATTLTDTTFSGTYQDNFKDSDNYHRILFNGGKALQARELTQMQTIINREIERFGSNIFREGGAVNGGNITINNSVEFIKLATSQLPADTDDILNKEFTVKSPNPAVKIKILEIITAIGSDPDTLIVEYVSTSAGTSGSTPIRVGTGHVLENSVLGSSYDMTVASVNASGKGSRVSISEGSFFVQGHFVFTPNQSLFLSKYTNAPTEDIGFRVHEQVIDITDDTALYDISNGVDNPNTAAPGADRYQIRLILTTRTLAGTDPFVYLARVVDGKLADEVTVDESYNAINNVLATRTKEESGDYIVKPYNIGFTNVDSANLTLKVSDGIAYVDGYRLETDEISINIPKPKTTVTINSESVAVNYGNYVLGYGNDITGDGSLLAKVNQSLPDITTNKRFNLRSAVNHGGSTIGTGRCRAIYRDANGYFRFYLYDIRMKSANSFNEVVSFGTSATDYVNVVLEGGQAVLKGTANNSLLFPLPRSRPAFDGIEGVQMIAQKKVTVGPTGGGASTLTNVGGGDITTGINEYSGGTNWVVTGTDSAIVPAVVSGVGANFDLAGLEGSHSYHVYSQVKIAGSTNLSQRSKTLTERAITKEYPVAADSDGAGGDAFISLDRADIFAVKSIKVKDSNGADISSNFIVDNGQRDNYYGIGRIIPKTGVSIPSDNIFIRFQHFEHEDTLAATLAGRRCYFDVTSYKNQTTPANGGQGVIHSGVDYATIPNHTLADGSTINLRDVLDFRPVGFKQNVLHSDPSHLGTANNNAFNLSFDSDGAGSNPLIHLLPQPGASPTVNVDYYLPRKDILVAATKDVRGKRIPTGEIRYIQGTPAIEPKYPTIPAGALPIYNIHLNANTLDENDLETEMIPARRFTMADIGAMERRIDQIQELTALSLLEVETSSLSVLDSSGNTRTKAGFLVDNFKDYAFTDAAGGQQRAVINNLEGLLTPMNFPRNTRWLYDSSGASTTKHMGDMLFLGMSDSSVTFIDQNIATRTMNINPFAVITSDGHILLSPKSDNWIETKHAPDKVVKKTEIIQLPTFISDNNLGNHIHNWIGKPYAVKQGGQSFQAVVVRGNVRTRRQLVNNRVLDVDVIPYMRSIKVFFKAQGLRRLTRHYPYFGGEGGSDISNYTKSLTANQFKRFSNRAEDDGNIFTGHTTHPETASNLISDSTGRIFGSFIIPSNSELKFKTGSQQFKLLDITGGIDSSAISFAHANFHASGVIQTRQRTFEQIRTEERRIIMRENKDPLAQSFFISGQENPNGVFITKVDVHFASKEDNFGVPVQLQIRPIIAGVPHHSPIENAVVFLNPEEITNVVANTNSTTLSAVRAAPTQFKFDEPVYLSPGQEYAVVLLAESTAYTVYTSKIYEFELGSQTKRVSKQPSLGSLFTSQNGSTWTPEQSQDLMFKIYRAEFNTSAVATFKNASVARKLLEADPFTMTSGSTTVKVAHTGHGFSKGDRVFISGSSNITALARTGDSDLSGGRAITGVDHTGYSFAADSAPNATMFAGGSTILATQNVIVDTFIPQVQTTLPPKTSLTAQIKLANGLSYAGSTARSAASGAGSSYSAGSYKDCLINEVNHNDAPGIILSDSNQSTASLSPSGNLKLSLSTTDTKVSPVIDLQRISLLSFENIIDNQANSPGTNVNVPLSYVAETDATEGSHAAKHVTKTVTLEESAVGLKILFAANRPAEAEFEVYFKTGTADDDFNSTAWSLIGENGSQPADNDVEVFREYEFLPGGQVGNLSAFTKFQIKIVMTSTNSSKIPTIKDLRVIALVT